MGTEQKCHAKYGGREGEGKALLETESLIFRGSIRFSIPFAAIRSVAATKGELVVKTDESVAVLELGDQAAKWAVKIRKPKTLIEKLGVKSGMMVLAIGIDDRDFLAKVRETGATLMRKPAPATADIVFYGASSRKDIEILRDIADNLQPAGAIWIIRPKGRPEITEQNVMDAAKGTGLVDVKVAKFSETHTAEKLVIRLENRKGR